jgi:hypothetical protein
MQQQATVIFSKIEAGEHRLQIVHTILGGSPLVQVGSRAGTGVATVMGVLRQEPIIGHIISSQAYKLPSDIRTAWM